MRYRLLTLLILLPLAPAAFAGGYWLWRFANPAPDPAGVVIVASEGFVKDGVTFRLRREYRRNGTVGITIYRADGEAMSPEGD